MVKVLKFSPKLDFDMLFESSRSETNNGTKIKVLRQSLENQWSRPSLLQSETQNPNSEQNSEIAQKSGTR